jgi:phosphoribosylformimino-5-aminoimidazole carboxamide ribotide isomerase
MLIFPAIDIRGGKCVRLRQGDYSQETIYGEDPASLAASFVQDGATWIHVVDLDAARQGRPINTDPVQEIAKMGVRIQYGGGIRSEDAARQMIELGVDRVIVGSALVKDPELARLLFERYDDQIVAGVDARNGKVAVSGWEEECDVDAVELAARLAGQGCKRIVVTDIATDGMETGPNLDFLEAIKAVSGPEVIASGGVGNLQHLFDLRRIGLEGVIIGKAFYERRFTLREALQVATSPTGESHWQQTQ